jgi:hypothetical protein
VPGRRLAARQLSRPVSLQNRRPAAPVPRRPPGSSMSAPGSHAAARGGPDGLAVDGACPLDVGAVQGWRVTAFSIMPSTCVNAVYDLPLRDPALGSVLFRASVAGSSPAWTTTLPTCEPPPFGAFETGGRRWCRCLDHVTGTVSRSETTSRPAVPVPGLGHHAQRAVHGVAENPRPGLRCRGPAATPDAAETGAQHDCVDRVRESATPSGTTASPA